MGHLKLCYLTYVQVYVLFILPALVIVQQQKIVKIPTPFTFDNLKVNTMFCPWQSCVIRYGNVRFIGFGLPAGIPSTKALNCFFIFISGHVYSLAYGLGVNLFQENQYQSSKKITKDYKIKHKKNVVEVSSRQT